MANSIQYPYLPEGREIFYVPKDNKYIQLAKSFAKEASLDPNQPIGVVIVKNDKVIARGANGSDYHEKHGCDRKKQGIPSGQKYELCEGCHPKNHAEAKALKDARTKGLTEKDIKNSDVYLWGHWWCCQSCWEKMIAAGIQNVYLQEKSEVLFNRDHPGNIL